MAAQNAPMTVNVAVEVRLMFLLCTTTPMPHLARIPDEMRCAAAFEAWYSRDLHSFHSCDDAK